MARQRRALQFPNNDYNSYIYTQHYRLECPAVPFDARNRQECPERFARRVQSSRMSRQDDVYVHQDTLMVHIHEHWKLQATPFVIIQGNSLNITLHGSPITLVERYSVSVSSTEDRLT